MYVLDTRPFWITWIGEIIQLGVGYTTRKHQILEFNPREVAEPYRIQAFAFRTQKQVHGVWTVDKLAGKL